MQRKESHFAQIGNEFVVLQPTFQCYSNKATPSCFIRITLIREFSYLGNYPRTTSSQVVSVRSCGFAFSTREAKFENPIGLLNE